MSTSNATVNSDYIQFIKEYIVMRIKKEFDTTTETSEELLEKYQQHTIYYHKLNKWNTIHKYGDHYDLMDFCEANGHMALFTTKDPASIIENRIQTFQDFVDEMINVKKVGMFEYQQFIKLMKDPEFRKKLELKYRNEMEGKIVKLAILNDIANQKENPTSAPSFIDIMPYCEYKSKRSSETIVKELDLYEMEVTLLREIDEFFG